MTAAESGVRDCWNSIGVQGDSSCPELAKWTHCRNCPVYADAAEDLLDLRLDGSDLRAATLRVAAPIVTADRGARSVVIFRLGREWFAIRTGRLQEVAESRAFHTIPHRRGGFITGLVNVRGELLPYVSVSRLLGVDESSASSEGARIVVVHDEQGRFAFMADAVADVWHFHPQELHPPPATVTSNYTTGVLHWKDLPVSCLDDDLMVYAVRKALS